MNQWFIENESKQNKTRNIQRENTSPIKEVYLVLIRESSQKIMGEGEWQVNLGFHFNKDRLSNPLVLIGGTKTPMCTCTCIEVHVYVKNPKQYIIQYKRVSESTYTCRCTVYTWVVKWKKSHFDFHQESLKIAQKW